MGRADILTLDQARKKALRYLGQAADNADPQTQLDAASAAVTVAELVSQYVEKHAKAKKRSWKRDQNMLRAHLASFESRPAISVTTAQIEQLHAAHGVLFPYAANDLVSTVRKMYNWGRVAGLVPREMPNPGVGSFGSLPGAAGGS